MAREVDDKRFLTTQEVAKNYKTSRRTLYYLVEAGKLRSWKFPGDKKTYWQENEVQEALKPVEIDPKSGALAEALTNRAAA